MSEPAQVFAGTSMRWFTDQEVTSLMTSSRLNAKARSYMKSHPGVNYTEALAIVSGKTGPMAGGVMSDMISRIIGAGTPTPDLESAMQSLGFDFPPKEGKSAPVAASDVRTGDVVKAGDRYGLLLDDKGTVLLDGKLSNLADYDLVEFFRMPASSENTENTMFEEAKRYAEKSVFKVDAAFHWNPSTSPLYAVQRGDVLRFESGAAVYLGDGEAWHNGNRVRVTSLPDTPEVWRAVIFDPYAKLSPRGIKLYDGVELSSVVGPLTADNLMERWRRNEFTNHLHVPLGYDTSDKRVFGIDLAEAAMGGTGPHGCIQGCTGSGKTVLAHNISYALAADNSPTKVTFAFADYKGGATAHKMSELPHTVFAQGNMDHDEDARKALHDFVSDEMARRESLLNEHALKNHIDYTQARGKGRHLPPLPHLIVFIEEIDEALRSRVSLARETPERITRMGRALGIHLIAVSQVIDPASFRDMLMHMGFGVSLKTYSAAASRVVLGVVGAEELPVGKGDALVRYSERGDDIVDRFRVLFPIEGVARDEFVAAISHAASNWENMQS